MSRDGCTWDECIQSDFMGCLLAGGWWLVALGSCLLAVAGWAVLTGR